MKCAPKKKVGLDDVPPGVGPLLIASTGWNLKEDMEKAPSIQVMAVNHAGIFLPRVDHWVTTHPEYLEAWKAARVAHLHALDLPKTMYITHSHRDADVCWDIDGKIGRTSGLIAVVVALHLGYDPIILAGMPADNGGHFYPGPAVNYGTPADERVWREIGTRFPGRVSALGGNLADWLAPAR